MLRVTSRVLLAAGFCLGFALSVQLQQAGAAGDYQPQVLHGDDGEAPYTYTQQDNQNVAGGPTAATSEQADGAQVNNPPQILTICPTKLVMATPFRIRLKRPPQPRFYLRAKTAPSQTAA